MSSPRPNPLDHSLKSRVQVVVDLYIRGLSPFNTTGKKRAEAFLASIDSINDEDQLLRRIYFDATQKKGLGRLDTSTELRKALLLVLDVGIFKVKLTRELCAKKSLVETIEEYCDHYLLSLSSTNKEGKERAENYKRTILTSPLSEGKLAAQIYNDAASNRGVGPLETSTDLRISLLKALGEFNDLESAVIKKSEEMHQQASRALSFGSSGIGGGGHIPSPSYFRLSALKTLLEAKYVPKQLAVHGNAFEMEEMESSHAHLKASR